MSFVISVAHKLVKLSWNLWFFRTNDDLHTRSTRFPFSTLYWKVSIRICNNVYSLITFKKVPTSFRTKSMYVSGSFTRALIAAIKSITNVDPSLPLIEFSIVGETAVTWFSERRIDKTLLFAVSFLFYWPVAKLKGTGDRGYFKAAGMSIGLS